MWAITNGVINFIAVGLKLLLGEGNTRHAGQDTIQTRFWLICAAFGEANQDKIGRSEAAKDTRSKTGDSQYKGYEKHDFEQEARHIILRPGIPNFITYAENFQCDKIKSPVD